MDGSGSNLTIDFSDASFDNSSENEQPVPGVDNIDVVFPIDDNPEITVGSGAFEKTGHDYSDNRSDVNTAAQAVALMPSGTAASMMDEFIFEFDNDENDDGDTTTTDQGLKITSKADGPSSQTVELNLEGAFENLHDGGTLDLYVNQGTVSHPDFDSITLGMSNSNDGTMGSVVGGDMNGGNMGGGNDMAVINVDATTAIQGMYKGGSGYDSLQLVEGVRSDNGAIVDFYFGEGGTSSAEVLPASDLASEVAFQIDEWESIQLTDNADTILISGGVGDNLTNTYDAPYWNPGASNSMLKLQTGYTDGEAADIVKVNADSNLYMSFEFANDSDVGIDAIFRNNGNVDIESIGGSSKESPIIDVEVDKTGGTGMTIDYFEATSNKDEVENNSDIGVMVDLGGSAGDADVFKGSHNSQNDVLDARMTSDLNFSEAGSYIKVISDDNSVNAKIKNVDYIMITDKGSDVDFYEDMSHLNDTKLIDGLGAGASDAYGVGYDVVTSAQVDEFADDNDLRVYYEGDHDDFIDTDDDMTYSDGVFTMSSGDSSRGSTWESEIESTNDYGSGQEPGFYVEISGKKVAVTFDDEKGSWKVDSSALKVAEDASSNIDMSSISNKNQFASDVMDRFGLKPDTSQQESASKSNFVIDSTDNVVTQQMLSGGFPVINLSGTADGTVGHNGNQWVLDLPSLLVEQEKFDSISQMETFIGGKGINVSTITLTSTESAGSPEFDGISWGSIGSEDWYAYRNDNTLDYWYPGQRYDMIDLPTNITGQVDVWNQTLQANYNNNYDYTDLIIGILDKTTGKIIQDNDDNEPDKDDYTDTLAKQLADSPDHRSGVDSFISFNVEAGHEYAVMVGDLGESSPDPQDRSFEGGGYDLYAVSDVGGANETVVINSNNTSTNSTPNHSFSDDIYLNASEEAIDELLDNGSVSDKAFNFSFYTKMDLVTDEGNVTVNVKLQEDGGNQFSIDADDIDVGVESFYNVADDAGAAVTSSSAAGEFVKIDDAGDIALGNGGDDTYVVGDDDGDIYGGIALEYGNIGVRGGLTGSVDAVNFNSVDSVADLTFERGKLRNEDDGSSLFIGDGSGNETVLFDNYNEYLDFRRVEYLTVEDGANNDEIYEIVTDASNAEKNLDWDNEIYVANGGSMDVELGGIDYVVGSDNADTFNVSLYDMMSAGSGTINLSNVTSDDTINVTDAGSLSAEDQAQLNATLEAGLASGGGEIDFSFNSGTLTIDYDSVDDNLDIVNQQFDLDAISMK